jgi:hypothetical protein
MSGYGGPPPATEPAPGDPGAWIDLPGGGDLSLQAAEEITRAAVSRVIVLAGAADSGKTTCLASVYECFQRGPVGGYAFAGSHTLLGFERRCYMGRITSGRRSPDTARAPAGAEAPWLHLRVRPAAGGPPSRDLLLSEIPGDAFRLARDVTDECRRLTAVRRADHLAILVDGASLVARPQRFPAGNDAALFLRSCLDAEMLGPSSLVEVVFAKWDLVAMSAAAGEIEEYVDAFAERTRQFAGGRLGRLRFLRIASRPRPGSGLPFAQGLAELVRSWVEGGPARGEAAGSDGHAPDTGERRRDRRPRVPVLWSGGQRA